MRRAARLTVALLLALAAGAASVGALAASPADAARDVLADRSYRFCHDPAYPLSNEERQWCPLVREASCPAFARACASGGAAVAARPPARSDRGPTASLPDPMSPVASIVFVGLLALGAVAVIVSVLRNRVPAADAPAPEMPDEATREAAAATPRATTDPERLLASARDAAARGDHARAVTDAYAALLRHLDGAGLVELRTSSTNGDYVRALQGQRELRGRLRAVVREVEGVQFGHTDPRAVWTIVLENVAPVIERAASMAVVVALGVALSGCRPSHGSDPSGPLGRSALVQVLAENGVRATRRHTSLGEIEPHVTTLVMLGEVPMEGDAWADVETWVHERGGNLVLVGVPSTPPELAPRPIPEHASSASLEVVPAWAPALGSPRVALPPLASLEPSLLDEPIVVRGGSTYATSRVHGEGTIVVLADDQLFTNVSLATADNAELLVALLRLGGEDVQLADAFSGGARSPVESLRRAHLLPATLQALVLVALFLAWKGAGFGRLRDRAAASRRAFVEHVRAVGATYARAGASRHALGVYAAWVLDRLRTRTRAGGGLLRLAEVVAARTGREERAVLAVLVEAHGARETEGPRSARGNAADVERDLTTLRELAELVHATRTERSRNT